TTFHGYFLLSFSASKCDEMTSYFTTFPSSIIPFFGNRMMDKITPAIVQNFANQNVKYKRYREFISNTSRIFDYAIRMDLIRENPVKKNCPYSTKKVGT
ncbi:MAG: hypothetical protein RR583_02635, partial [Enterococcus sp.]